MTVCYKCQGNWQTSPRHICIYDHRTRGSTWVKHCYGLVPLRRSSVATDAADILEQGIGSSSPAEDGRALIEHIIKCMYNLYGPSWGPVTTFGYVITDSRIYPPPPPFPPADRGTRISESKCRRLSLLGTLHRPQRNGSGAVQTVTERSDVLNSESSVRSTQ